MRSPLRAKGILSLVILTAYLVAVGVILAGERQKLLTLALSLEQVYERNADVARTEYSIHHSQLRLQSLLLAPSMPASAADDIALDMELVQAGLQRLHAYYPTLWKDIAKLDDQVAGTRDVRSRASLVDLYDVLNALEAKIAMVDQELRSRHHETWVAYYRVYEGMTIIAVATLVFAILVFGTVVSIFFSRLTWDIRRLEDRAGQIVAGYRGDPLPVTRLDEVGRLMAAVNRMQLELRKRERELEVVRQQRFHQEKMAAVGSLAAAVAHEINNPIAAIAGIARTMASTPAAPDGKRDFEGDGPQLILDQTERISAISRQVAEFTRPHSPTPELTDLNRLVRSVCKFTGYDERLRAVPLALDLDPGMPAVNCVADHVTQVLMNLLINAGDAVRGLADRKPSIVVSSQVDGPWARIRVEDNGHGMSAEVMARVFDEGFTTKSSNQGLGLGLFLCKALVEGDGDGGRIEIDSTPGVRTAVTVRLPIAPPGAA